MPLSVWGREMWKWEHAPVLCPFRSDKIAPCPVSRGPAVEHELGEWRNPASIGSVPPAADRTGRNEACLEIPMWRSDDQAEWRALELDRKVFDVLIFMLCNRFLTPTHKPSSLRLRVHYSQKTTGAYCMSWKRKSQDQLTRNPQQSSFQLLSSSPLTSQLTSIMTGQISPACKWFREPKASCREEGSSFSNMLPGLTRGLMESSCHPDAELG